MIRVAPRPRIYVKKYGDYVMAKVGVEFTLWVANLFNPSVYDLTLQTDIPFIKVSDYEYKMTPDATGFFTVSVVATNKEKLKSKPSITLLIVVI